MNYKLLFILALLVPLAHAEIQVNKYTNEFALYSQQIDGKTCAGATHTFPFTIDNVGDLDAVFNIDIQSTEPFWNAEQDSITLASGEQATTTLTANIPFTYTGTIDYTITVDSTYGREKRLDRSLEVVKCQNVVITPNQTTQVINPGQTARYSFTVENHAPFEDTYTIRAADYADNIRFSTTNFTLGEDETQQIYAYAHYSDDTVGDYTLPIEVTAAKNDLTKSLDLNLRINDYYPFSINTPRQGQACGNLGTQLPITITNDGTVANTYRLTLDTDAPLALSQDNVELNPGQTANLTLDIPPGTTPGTYNADLTTTQRLGDETTTSTTTITVNNCYDVTITAPQNPTLVCGDHNLPVEVENTGTRQSTYDLTLQGPAWADVEPTSVTLQPNERRNIQLALDAPCADTTADLTVTATHNQYDITQQASTTVTIKTERSGHQLTLEDRNIDVRITDDELDLPVRNDGISTGTYGITIDSAFLTPQQDTITIEPGQTRDVTFTLDADGLELGEYIHDITFDLHGTNVTYETRFGTNLLGPTILEQVLGWIYWVLIGSSWYTAIGLAGWSTLLLILLLAALVYVYIQIRRDEIETKRFTVDYRTHFRILYAALALLAIISLLFAVTSFSTDKDALYAPAQADQGPLFHQFKQGHTYELDVAQYFTDPDDDALTYGYEQGTNLSVSFQDGTALLRSAHGGTTTIVFTATDTAGATERSSPMTIYVREKTGTSWNDVWIANANEVNAFFLAFFFIFLIALADTIAPRGRDYYFNE